MSTSRPAGRPPGLNAADRRRPRSAAEYLGFAAGVAGIALLATAPSLAVYPLAMFLLSCALMPFFPGFSFFFPVISRGRTDRQSVSLTFDDGPDPVSTPLLLNILKQHRVTATFFVTGERARRYPELIRDIVAGGHSVGNHSYSHDDFIMFCSIATLVRELEQTQEALRQCGVEPLVFRPPVGITTPRYAEALWQTGLAAVTFRRRPGDLGNRRIRNLAGRILTGVRPGDIVLLHDRPPRKPADHRYWLTELEHLLQGLQERGLQVVPLEDLIERPVMIAAPITGCATPPEPTPYTSPALTKDQVCTRDPAGSGPP